jgi:NADPH2:quinone reductase
MLERVARGDLRPVEPSVVPLERAVDALRNFAERRVVGKVVLVP